MVTWPIAPSTTLSWREIELRLATPGDALELFEAHAGAGFSAADVSTLVMLHEAIGRTQVPC